MTVNVCDVLPVPLMFAPFNEELDPVEIEELAVEMGSQILTTYSAIYGIQRQNEGPLRIGWLRLWSLCYARASFLRYCKIS